MGDNSNCLRCGSNVADKNPIDTLVAAMLSAQTITAGIRRRLTMDAGN